MGQYHQPVNLDKKQYINPHKLGNGLKMLEFGQGGLTVTALTVLLACSQNRGGGDLSTENPIAGSWAGDRIAIIGDYTEPDDIDGIDAKTVADAVWGDTDEYSDISEDVLVALLDDSYIKSKVQEQLDEGYWFGNTDRVREIVNNHGKEQDIS